MQDLSMIFSLLTKYLLDAPAAGARYVSVYSVSRSWEYTRHSLNDHCPVSTEQRIYDKYTVVYVVMVCDQRSSFQPRVLFCFGDGPNK